MQTSRVFDALADAFPGDPQSTDPVDPRWQRLTDQVAGYTGPNELAVLNVAAAALPDGEAYLEVGTFKGRSLVAASRATRTRRSSRWRTSWSSVWRARRRGPN